MENFDLASLIPYFFVTVVLLILLLIVLKRILVNVGAKEIAIKERRYFGAKMPPGRAQLSPQDIPWLRPPPPPRSGR